LDVDGGVPGAGEVAEIEGGNGLFLPGFGYLGFGSDAFTEHAGGAGDLGGFVAVERFCAASAGRRIVETSDDGIPALGGTFEGSDLALFGFVGGPVFLVQGFRVVKELCVGSREWAEPAAADFKDAGGELVEEIFVVGDEEAGVFVAQQLVGKPVAGAGVEVVRRFIEQEDAGGFVENFSEAGAGALAGGEVRVVAVAGLGKMGDGEAARFGDDTPVWRLRAAENAEQGGLPCPVGADERDAIAGVDIEIDRLKQRVLLRIAEREATGLQLRHISGPVPVRGRKSRGLRLSFRGASKRGCPRDFQITTRGWCGIIDGHDTFTAGTVYGGDFDRSGGGGAGR